MNLATSVMQVVEIIILAILLTSYLVGMGIKYGIPDMVSDTYYQGTCGKAFPAVTDIFANFVAYIYNPFRLYK